MNNHLEKAWLCKHDLIMDRQLQFKKGLTYYQHGGGLQSHTGKFFELIDFPVKFSLYFKELSPANSTLKGDREVISFTETKKDNVNHPDHYKWLKDKCGIEVIDITRHLDFDLGNAVKYILRAGHKTDASLSDREKEIEDLKKAIWYINDKIQAVQAILENG